MLVCFFLWVEFVLYFFIVLLLICLSENYLLMNLSPKNITKNIIQSPIFIMKWLFDFFVTEQLMHHVVKSYLLIRKPTKQSYRQQQEVLFKLIAQAENTVFGRQYGFSEINSIKDFQHNVPLATYKDFEHRIHYMLRGEKNITYPGKIVRFATSSGTK